MSTLAVVTYLLCAAVSAACTLLLFRSWRRTQSRLVSRAAWGFAFITLSNVLLVADLPLAADLSVPRAVLIAIGLGVLLYGVAWEEQP